MVSPSRMSPADTALLVIDMQEKLLAKIPGAEVLIYNISFMIDAAQLLGLPVLATEQYPQGLGPTAPLLAQKLPERPAKVAFSCCAVPAVRAALGGRPQVVLSGIESHVCVLGTALDLLAAGHRVYVAVDAIASRFVLDHDWAVQRLLQAGVVPTTAETCVFEWLGGADHPQFKKVSALVQERMRWLADQGASASARRPLAGHSAS
jgi:nicotinamidase-related amidase